MTPSDAPADLLTLSAVLLILSIPAIVCAVLGYVRAGRKVR